MKRKLKVLVMSIIAAIFIATNINIVNANAATTNYDDVLVGVKNLNGTASNSAKLGDTLLEPEVGWSRYDDTNSKIEYVGSTWIKETEFKSTMYKGTRSFNRSSSETVKVKFASDFKKIRILGIGGASSTVFIDGKNVGKLLNTLGSGLKSGIIFEYEAPTVKNHVVEIVIDKNDRNKPDSYISLDAIDVSGGVSETPKKDTPSNPKEYIPSKVKDFQAVGNKLVNNAITLKGDATPSNDTLYKFYVCDRSTEKWTDLTQFSAQKQVNWTPTKPGKYTVVLHVKHMLSPKTTEDDYRSIDLDIGYSSSKLLGFNLTGNKVVNNTLQLSANATPSNETLYKFYACDRSTEKWTDLTQFSTENKVNWKPTKPGKYTVVVHVKNKYSNTKTQDDYRSIDLIVNDYVPSKLSEFNVIGSNTVNSVITMGAKATPTSDTLYKFWIGDRSTEKWTDLTEYTTNSKVTWKPTKPGTYRLVVHVKSKYSTKETEDDYKYFDIVVSEGNAVVNEALYWIDKIPYHIDSVIITQKLDKNNPPKYMDCADFTSSVYYTVNDKKIGTNTGSQKKYGIDVDISGVKNGNYSKLLPGDLIFFTWPGGDSSNGDHVALYIGNGQIVHESGTNSTGGNVKKNSLNDNLGSGILRNNIISIRRVI